jgi:hypothetical protein
MRYDPASAAGAKRHSPPGGLLPLSGVRSSLLFPLEMGQKQAGETARLSNFAAAAGE